MTQTTNQPNPYKQLRKEIIQIYYELGKTLEKVDRILKRLQNETQ
jgi:division protein CdvB (Snf7/Vps24/ESCRT-III family)